MNARIEVGMLVEIVDHPLFVTGRRLIGHVGKVLSADRDDTDYFSIEGATIDPEDGEGIVFYYEDLRPIPDDSAFQTFLGEAFKPVDISVGAGVTGSVDTIGSRP